MKLTHLKQIKAEHDRCGQKLQDAIERAMKDTTQWDYELGKEILKPIEIRDCYNTKEAAAFKRAALDLKRTLANL